MVKLSGNKKYGLTIAILSCFIVGLFFVSFLIGRYSIHPRTVLDIFFSNYADIGEYWHDDLDIVVMQVRLPRIMLGILVGGALSVSGASYQTLFKNPMAAPDILGVSAGAGLQVRAFFEE
jgi:iron complex transport system permease protein